MDHLTLFCFDEWRFAYFRTEMKPFNGDPESSGVTPQPSD